MGALHIFVFINIFIICKPSAAIHKYSTLTGFALIHHPYHELPGP